MNTVLDATKLTKLHELDSLLPREIRGQSHALPRIISTLKRGELGLCKPGRPRGSFLLLGPTGVGKTEVTVVFTNHLFGDGTVVPLRHVGVSESGSTRPVARREAGRARFPRRNP
jgi:ATP-dependent Clp protease ATP-binding subunit ClpA